jgi:hypothetical protein
MPGNGSEDPYGKQYDQEPYIDTEKDYELEQMDKDSIAEIRKLLKEGKYKDPAYLRDHIEYLEDLIQKLTRVFQEERKRGKMNLTLEHDIAKVKELFDQLARLLDNIEGI